MAIEVEQQDQDQDPYHPLEHDHVVALFFQGWKDGDWLATVWVRDGVPMGSYRIRTYVDDKVFDSQDFKTWRCISGPKDADPEILVEALHRMADYLDADHNGAECNEYIRVDGPPTKLVELLADKPWASVKSVPKDVSKAN